MTTKTEYIANAFKRACYIELEALKPGNVHIFADGHGMTVDDFRRSANLCEPIIADPRLPLGQRIKQCIIRTIDGVGCNTNLGLILLSAPLIAAIHNGDDDLSQDLANTLRHDNPDDVGDVFAAIAYANPAGLGNAELYDVHGQNWPTNLKSAMAPAAKYDRIAYQYAHDFVDIFDFGRQVLCYALKESSDLPQAVSATYMAFLASFPDSHIQRKYGADIAHNVQCKAQEIGQYPSRKILLEWDQMLKADGLNPGTSADLTVATLLVHILSDIVN